MSNRALTDEDIKLLRESFASKEDHEDLKALVQHLPTKEEFFSKMDELMGEVKAMREEQTTHAQQHVDINDKFDQVGAKLKLDLSFLTFQGASAKSIYRNWRINPAVPCSRFL